jgi:metal-responsive CopG/Arc/MetJ family transcriptional regulator
MMKNVQISFDENLLNSVDQIAASTNLSRSAIIREALKKWIQEAKIKEFENEWIKSLKKNPDDVGDKRAEVWINAEHWGDL